MIEKIKAVVMGKFWCNIEINQSPFLYFLDYQNSERRMQLNDFLNERFSVSLNFSIETLMEEISRVLLEKMSLNIEMI